MREVCRTRSILAVPWALALWCAGSHGAYAQFVVGGDATAKYEYDSNVFDLPSGVPVGGHPGTGHADWFQAYGATFQAYDTFDRDRVFLNLTGTRLIYDRFTNLTHTEYNADLGLVWQAIDQLDGKFDVVRSSAMVPFTNLTQTDISVLTDQSEDLLVNWGVVPHWRLQGFGLHHSLTQPLEGAPELKLSESIGRLTLQYLGREKLIVGGTASFSQGSYSGASAATNPSYHQETGQFDASYQFTVASLLTGNLGYTRRTSAAETNSSSGVTGGLTFRDQITPKTSLNFGVARSVQSYIANLGSEVDTSATAGAYWQATYRLTVGANYTYTFSVRPDQGLVNAQGAVIPSTINRDDHLQVFGLKIDYQPLRWLYVEPYANLQTRSSNAAYAKFNASSIGLTFNVLLHCPVDKCDPQKLALPEQQARSNRSEP